MKTKTTCYCLLVLALLLPAVALSAEVFEGVFSVRTVNSHGRETTAKFSLKQDLARYEVSIGKGSVTAIIDRKANVTKILMPEKKSFVIKPQEAAAPGSSQPSSELEETSEKNRLLEFECQKYTLTQGESVTEIWATKEIGALPLDFKGNFPPKPNSWEEAVMHKGLFPMKAVTTKAGKQVGSIEIVSLKRGSVPDDAFSIPAGWTEISKTNDSQKAHAE